jgi:hypothetical protein
MKTDYNSISFRNKDIDRLSGTTTKSPGQAVAEARNARNGNTPEAKADQAAKQAMKNARKELR